MTRIGFGLMISWLFVLAALAKQSSPAEQLKGADASDSFRSALILDSGSTNTPGYRVTVYDSGRAEWSISGRKYTAACASGEGKLPPKLTRRFFQELKSLMPLDKLPATHCMKSASFGTTLRVTYHGTVSPDLSCPRSDTGTSQLLKDVADINRALGINPTVIGAPPQCRQNTTLPNQ